MSSIIDSLYDATSYKASSSSSANTTGGDRFQELGTEAFLKLMVAELQNQDPMNPTDNAQMLQQINQIREISSNDKLSTSLDAVLLGQNMATAAGLIGQTVTGTNSLGETTTGTVDRVVFEKGAAKLHVGTAIISVDDIIEMSNGTNKATTSNPTAKDTESSSENQGPDEES